MMICCPFCHQDNPAGITECEHCVATLPRPGPLTVTPELEKQIQSLLEERSKIEAIKWFREHTGSGLKEAKDAVEAIELGRPFAVPGRTGKAFESELIELLQADRKIEAIKRFRAETGAGLKEAKDAVEAIERGSALVLAGGPDERFEAQLTELLQSGRKIEAIKQFRKQTGCGLKQAKDAVEQFAAAHCITRPLGIGCLNVLRFAAAVAVHR